MPAGGVGAGDEWCVCVCVVGGGGGSTSGVPGVQGLGLSACGEVMSVCGGVCVGGQ